VVQILATWAGTGFPAFDTSGKRIEHRSLLEFVTLILGPLLPQEIYRTLVRRLVSEGHLTTHGLATEPPDSPLYRSDGYWRGPIWAPSTYLIFDGLRAGGQTDFAQQVAESFCQLVADGGMAENFDALTGEGLRDRAYTWTASVFLLLAHWLETTQLPR
jgi:glycogen debranching enzyme